MKKYIAIIFLALSFPVYSQNYQWIMISKFFTNADQPTIYRYIDIANIQVISNYKYFWYRTDMNNLFKSDGTRFNRTYFSMNKIDCNKKIWTSTWSQTFIDGIMTENIEKNIHWNIMDTNDKHDQIILRFICNQ